MTPHHALRPAHLSCLAVALAAVLETGCRAQAADVARAAGASARAVTVSSLLGEMTDLASMTRFPSPAYSTREFTSYDRASGPPRWEWFANNDRGQYLRVDEGGGRREKVMVDAAGPGALVRLWSADPGGTLRIYLDGSEAPAIEAKMSDLLSGAVDGFPAPLGIVEARGYNLHFPIPFARSCRVTTDGGDIYYAASVRQYAPGTNVQTFRRQDVPAVEVRAAASRLGSPQAQGVRPQKTRAFAVRLAPGRAAILGEFRGAGAITSLRARLGAGLSDPALRALVLRARFDGQQTIEVPLADFFGSAPGASPFATLPLGITRAREAWSHWVMPWRRSARLELANLGAATAALRGDIGTAPYVWSEDSMHFHAGYKSRYDVPTRPAQDLQVLEAGGQGVFAGLSLAIDNPSVQWWGEGDEKVYVDGEAFPSWFGTGSEDYFGYAWGDLARFEHAYHAQPRAEGSGMRGPDPGYWGRTSNSRFHILDRIPFRRSLRFDLELLHWAETKVNLATVAYWYARPGSVAAFAPLLAQDVEVRPMPAYVAPAVPGAIEGEAMRVASNTAPSARPGPQAWGGLSGEKQLLWHPSPRPGDSLTLLFDAPGAGRYRVLGRFLGARDYGIHQIAINGAQAGTPRDFYAPDVIPMPEVELGTFELKAGGNAFTATAVGSNPAADTGAVSLLLGLDYLRLQPAP